MTRIVGLTGGIGSGKSTVAAMLRDLGATVLDADAIVREIQAPGGAALAEIVEAFGPDVLDASGSLDRDALGAIVFRDESARKRLNSIVHPKVGAEMARRVAAAVAAGVELLVLDIPLLFEGRQAGTGTASVMRFDATVVVYASRETQIERQIAREGYDRAEAERRIAAQMPLEEKKQLADHVIDNSGTLDDTERQVRALYESLLA